MIPKINRTGAYLNNLFWLFLTYLLAPYFYFLILLKSKMSENKKLKILVIHNGKIGDLVGATPIFREIKEKFPSAHLAALVISIAKGVLKNNPRVDEIISITDYAGIGGKFRLLSKLRKEKYDWAFNIFPDSFTNVISFWSLVPNRVTTTHKYSGEIIKLLSSFSNHRLEYKRHTSPTNHYLNLLKFIGIEGASNKRELFILPEEKEKTSDFLMAHNFNNDDLLVGISVTAGVGLKEWQSEGFAELADKLIKENNAKIIFVGSAADLSRVEQTQKMMQNISVNAAGRFELHELPALLQKLKLFISVDNGPLCMAAALDVPVVDIAGPIDLEELYPLNARSKILQKKIYCVSCSHVFDAARFCKEKHIRCLREITAEEVFEAASDIINKNKI